MSVHYPAGIKIVDRARRSGVTAKKKKPNFRVAPANRGMALEDDINKSNQYYLEKGLALITKRPTPINIVKVDYSKGAKIVEAFFETQSTTDYNGVYKSRYLDFEAKSTHSKTSLPLNNIPPQQIKHLKNVMAHGGIAFFIINIVPLDATYVLDAKYVCDFYERKPRKSIPVSEIIEHGHLIKESYRPRFDYLPIIDDFFLASGNDKNQ